MSFVLDSDDIIRHAIEHYETVETYVVTLPSVKHGHLSEEIRYYYKKPGYVRMEFITLHKGAVLVYNPETKKVSNAPSVF